jgi:hypothetical protein
MRIDGYELRAVLFPDERGKTQEGIAIVVSGGPFPTRALDPQIHVGGQEAELVQLLDGGARVRGILRKPPARGDELVVHYDVQTEARARIEQFEVRPLPKGC